MSEKKSDLAIRKYLLYLLECQFKVLRVKCLTVSNNVNNY